MPGIPPRWLLVWLAGGAICSHGAEQINPGNKPFDGMTRLFEPRLVLSLVVGGIGFSAGIW